MAKLEEVSLSNGDAQAEGEIAENFRFTLGRSHNHGYVIKYMVMGEDGLVSFDWTRENFATFAEALQHLTDGET